MCCAFVFGSCSNATLRLYLHKLAARGSGSSPRLKVSAQAEKYEMDKNGFMKEYQVSKDQTQGQLNTLKDLQV